MKMLKGNIQFLSIGLLTRCGDDERDSERLQAAAARGDLRFELLGGAPFRAPQGRGAETPVFYYNLRFESRPWTFLKKCIPTEIDFCRHFLQSASPLVEDGLACVSRALMKRPSMTPAPIWLPRESPCALAETVANLQLVHRINSQHDGGPIRQAHGLFKNVKYRAACCRFLHQRAGKRS